MSELKLARGREGGRASGQSQSSQARLRLDYFAGSLNPANQEGTVLVVSRFIFIVVLALGVWSISFSVSINTSIDGFIEFSLF